MLTLMLKAFESSECYFGVLENC